MYSTRKIILLLCIVSTFGQIVAQTRMGRDFTGDQSHLQFANSVSMSQDGNIMAISGVGDSGNDQFPYVRVFSWDGVVWTPMGNDIEGEFLTNFAPDFITISSDGTTVAIPFSGNDDLAPANVRVFDWDGAAWGQRGATITEQQANSRFGYSTQISGPGDHLIIGAAATDTDELAFIGAVYVYEWLNGVWSQKGSGIFGTEVNEGIGKKVDVSDDGNRIVIGSRNKDANGIENSGEVRAYEFVGDDWEQIGQTFEGIQEDEYLGVAAQITADGNRIIFSGGLDENEEHEIRIFDWQNDEWTANRPAIVPVNAEVGFATQFAIGDSGDQIAVRINGDIGLGQSRITLYEWRTGSYVRVGAYINANSSDFLFGTALTISGDGHRLAAGTFAASNDGRLAAYDYATLVPVYEASSFSFSVFPNPTTDVLTLRGNQLGELRLLDATGRQFLQYQSAPASINLHGLPSGTYFLQVRQGDHWVSRRIVR